MGEVPIVVPQEKSSWKRTEEGERKCKEGKDQTHCRQTVVGNKGSNKDRISAVHLGKKSCEKKGKARIKTTNVVAVVGEDKRSYQTNVGKRGKRGEGQLLVRSWR